METSNRLNLNSAQDDGQSILRYTPEGYIEVNVGGRWTTYHWARELFDACLALGRDTERGKILNRAYELYRKQMALWDKEEAESLRQQCLN
jgi:hypothetical protein